VLLRVLWTARSGALWIAVALSPAQSSLKVMTHDLHSLYVSRPALVCNLACITDSSENYSRCG
jgi:hypothetical protein